mgnify:CR=1 FL=1
MIFAETADLEGSRNEPERDRCEKSRRTRPEKSAEIRQKNHHCQVKTLDSEIYLRYNSYVTKKSGKWLAE